MVTVAAGGKVIICTTLGLGDVVVMVLQRRLPFRLVLQLVKPEKQPQVTQDAAQLMPSLVSLRAIDGSAARRPACNMWVKSSSFYMHLFLILVCIMLTYEV